MIKKRSVREKIYLLKFLLLFLIFLFVLLIFFFIKTIYHKEVGLAPSIGYTVPQIPSEYRNYIYESSSGTRTLRVFASIHTAGVHLSLTSPDSSVNSLALYYRKPGAQWIRGHDFSQITKTIDSSGSYSYTPLELYISSLFDLEPSTNYEVRVDSLSSSGSVINSIQITFTTQSDAFTFTPARTVIVDKNGNGDFTTIQSAIDSPQTTAGTRILVNPGVYKESLKFTKSGSKNNWIQLIANGPGVVLDGSKSSSQVFQGSWQKYTDSSATDGSNLWVISTTGDHFAIWMDGNHLFRHVAVSSVSGWDYFLKASSGHTADSCDQGSPPLNRIPEGWYMDKSNNKIYLRLEAGKNPNDRLFVISNEVYGVDIDNSDWLWIEGFDIKYFGNEETFRGGARINVGNYNIFRNNKLLNTNGFLLQWTDANNNDIADDGGSFNRIENNEITTGIKDSLTTYCKTKKGSDFYAVKSAGSVGNIIRNNVVHNIGENSIQIQLLGSVETDTGCDGSSVCKDFYYFMEFETDVYGNNIYNNVEGPEPDGGQVVNVRIFNNKISNLGSYLVSLQGGQYGPTWLIRNTWARPSNSQYDGGEVFKVRYPYLHRYAYVYHNVVYIDKSTSTYMRAFGLKNNHKNIFMKFRNNIFYRSSGAVATFDDRLTSSETQYRKTVDLDYNSYSSFLKPIYNHWVDSSWNVVDSIQTLCSNYGIECHGGYWDHGLSNPNSGDFTLKSGSKNIDSGLLINGINQNYGGSAPDIGAFEFGAPQIPPACVPFTEVCDGFDNNCNNQVDESGVCLTNTNQTNQTTPPVLSNGLPTGILPSGTTQTTLSLITNKAAACRYSTTAGVAYASMTNTFTITGAANHSTTVSGLQIGQAYNYYVRCQDTSGNANTNDFQIAFSVSVIDTTPPTVSITSPANDSTVQGDITINATASDNIALAQVEFFVDNSSIGIDTTAPYSMTWNSNSVAKGVHTILAKARDINSNNASSSINITVYLPVDPNPNPNPNPTPNGGGTPNPKPDPKPPINLSQAKQSVIVLPGRVSIAKVDFGRELIIEVNDTKYIVSFDIEENKIILINKGKYAINSSVLETRLGSQKIFMSIDSYDEDSAVVLFALQESLLEEKLILPPTHPPRRIYWLIIAIIIIAIAILLVWYYMFYLKKKQNKYIQVPRRMPLPMRPPFTRFMPRNRMPGKPFIQGPLGPYSRFRK